jgi:hypothetical protein
MTQTNFISAQNLISQTGWTNINAILLNNGTYAVSTPTTGLVSEFTVGNFLFNVPTGSLVSGLEFEFNAYRGITSLPSTTLELWAYDNTNSNNAWYQLTPVFTDLHLSASTFVLGGTTYTFNQNLTSDQVNNLKFKVIVNDEVYLGAFKVRVTYSEPVNSVTTSSSVCTTLLQAQPFKLLRPISATDTTCIVDKFKTSDGVDITTANLPVMGYPATIDPLTPKEENIKVLAVTVLSGDTRELTITRGWSFRDPDGQSPSLAKSHGLAELVLSNNFQYEQDKLRMCQIGSLVSEPITVFDEGGFIAKPVSAFDFVGSGVSVSQIADPLSLNGGKKAIVTINGTQPNTPNGNGGSTGTSGNTQVTNITYNTHSVSGTDRFTIISVSLESTATVTGITVGASLATFLGSSVQAGVRTEAWYVINTPLGINPVSVTTSSAVYLSSSQYTWNGVDQTLPIVLGSSSGANTNTSTGTGTTTVINSLLLHIIGTHQPSITYTAGSGENILSQTLTGQMQTAIQQQIVGTPSTQTSNIALSQITNWANIIASVNPTPVSVVTGQTNIQFQDEGSNLGTTGTVDTINITGTGATASRVGNTVTINVPGGVGSDEQVKVSATDTTTGYLDNKIELVNGTNTTVTKTILNPGANEKIQYQVNSTGGGSGNVGFVEMIPTISTVQPITSSTFISTDPTLTTTDNIYISECSAAPGSPGGVNITIYKYSKKPQGYFTYDGSFGTFNCSSITFGGIVDNPMFLNRPHVYQGNIYVPVINFASGAPAGDSFLFYVINGTTGAFIGLTNSIIPCGFWSYVAVSTTAYDDMYYNTAFVSPSLVNTWKIQINSTSSITLVNTYTNAYTGAFPTGIKLQANDYCYDGASLYNTTTATGALYDAGYPYMTGVFGSGAMNTVIDNKMAFIATESLTGTTLTVNKFYIVPNIGGSPF